MALEGLPLSDIPPEMQPHFLQNNRLICTSRDKKGLKFSLSSIEMSSRI